MREQNYETWVGLAQKGNVRCNRWDSFAKFMEDMGPRPSPKHVLGRLKPGKPFSPSNCKWMTRKEQCAHRRPKGTRAE